MLVRASLNYAWIRERTGCAVTRESRAIEAVDASGKVRGMVLYDGWTQNAVQAHMAADTPVAWRSLLEPAFRYPFEQCGKGVLLAVVPADNERSLELVRHFGFRQVAAIQDGWAVGVPLVTFEMRKENCRHLRHERQAA